MTPKKSILLVLMAIPLMACGNYDNAIWSNDASSVKIYAFQSQYSGEITYYDRSGDEHTQKEELWYAVQTIKRTYVRIGVKIVTAKDTEETWYCNVPFSITLKQEKQK